MRAVGSNVITFLFFLTFLLTTSSCSKEKYDVIPDVYVEFTIYFNDPQFPFISAATNSVLVNASTNNWGVVAAGFNNNGIIVYNTGDGFMAFDRTCPHCYKNAGNSVAVNVKDLGLEAICPECNTHYILNYGLPTSGPGRYYLKIYKTSYTPYYVRVWNR